MSHSNNLKPANNQIPAPPSDAILRAWEKTIDVQQHFNNIELTIRNYALTLFTGILAGIGYLYKEELYLTIWDYEFPISSIGALIGIVIMCSFYFMDKYWYHKLLIGSVSHAINIEQKYADTFNEIGLSSRIKDYSSVKIFGLTLKSDYKYYFFYYPLIVVFVLIYFALIIWS